ncbi:MAG: ATP12 family chaperone protein, partial [Alphaproteobacteria bacterium]
SLRLAEAMVDEWAAQEGAVKPETMPLTQLASTALDRVAPHRERVIDDIADFARTDLLCYRATSPVELAMRQHAHWQPLLDWAAGDMGAALQATEGVIAIPQADESLAAIRRAVASADDFRLAALHVFTTVSGSAVVALALLRGRIDAAEAWRVSQLDEDWQIEQWGEEATAAQRRRHLKAELDSAARFVTLL